MLNKHILKNDRLHFNIFKESFEDLETSFQCCQYIAKCLKELEWNSLKLVY